MAFSLPQSLHPSFLLAWFASGAITVFLPLLIFTIARLSYNGYEEEGSGDQNNNYNYNNCHWWQFRCNRRYNNNYNQDNNQGENEAGTPWWWIWGGEERSPEDEGRGALIFIYIYQVLIFTGILLYGFQVVRRGMAATHGGTTMAILIVFGNMSFLSLFYLGGLEGGVSTEGREMEETGFYGQFAVLMFLTNLLWTLFSLIFVLVLRKKVRHSNVTKMEFSESDYQLADEPEVQVTDKEAV